MDKKNVADLYPLSPMQQGMLFHTVYAPESGVYIEQAALALQGTINAAALQRTWQFVIDRHPILRTGFIWEGVKEPVQVVFRQVEVPFSVLDWREQDESAQPARLQAFLLADRQRGFVMQQAPLLRVTLIRTGEQHWQMIWTHHHILLDGWSVPLLLSEVIGVYAAFNRGETLDLPAPRPFRDYIAWLRRQDIKDCEAYWRRKLAGFNHRTPLGLARLTPERLATAPDFHDVETLLPADVTQALNRLARQQQTTLNNIAQSAWAILLSGYSGESDIVFGTTVSGRPVDLAGAEHMLGLFINTLPVRLQVPQEMPVGAWITEVQRQQGEQHQYEYSPLAQVQAWSDAPRGQPLFDSLFVFENFPAEMDAGQEGGDLHLRGEQSSSHTNYPLTVVAMPDREMLLKISYDATQFDRGAIERILGHLRRVLAGIAADPHRPVGRLSWMDEQEQQEIAGFSQVVRALNEPFRPAYGYVQVRNIAGEPVPVGVPGQVWLQPVGTGTVAGAGEAPTGERAQWLPGGALQYLGQVAGAPAPEAAARPTGRVDIVAPQLVSGTRPEHIPLSFAQQRLWFQEQIKPGSAGHHHTIAVRMFGALIQPALELALNEVVRRHESLRTTFDLVDGQPVQVIASELLVNFSRLDFSAMPEAERLAAGLRLAQTEAARPFDLSTAPLLRAHLVHLAQDDQLVLLTLPRVCGDDASLTALVGELAASYSGFTQGQPSPLPPLPIQYADFSVWQRSWLQGEVLQAHLNFWKSELAGAPAVLELPADFPRPAVQTFAGDYRSLVISSRLTDALRRLSRAEDASLGMTLLSAFEVLLYRYSGQEDFCISVPMANRNQAEVEGLIGLFANTVAVRANLADEPTFRDTLRQARERVLRASAHQDLPFEIVLDALQPKRDLSHIPFSQAGFALQNPPAGPLPMTGMRLANIEFHSGTTRFDLYLRIVEQGDGLSGALEYNTDLFRPETIERMLANFEVLLEGIAANPNERIWALPVLTESERQRLVVDWNLTTAPIPHELTVHQLFEQQVALTPAARAVSAGDRHLSYLELESRANCVANFIHGHGLAVETLVGVCMERTLDLPAALLGVLKAGCAYVPLDPNYPPERVAFMVSDSGAPLLLTQAHLLPGLQAATGQLDPPPVIICLDRDWEAIAAAGDMRLECQAGPRNLAYVIYTSGSTGRPKGAMIEHRGVVNYLSWCRQAYGLHAGHGSPVHSSISFDLTVTSLFSPLVSGGRALLLSEEQGVETLAQALRGDEGFSLVKITPAHLQMLGEQLAGDRDVAAKTHAFIIGGENLLADHLAFWRAHAPDTALVNEYGPTETVVGCCVYWVPPDRHTTGIIPIGRPIINTQLYVLDKHRQLTPQGAPGELVIGGAGVGRGYLNRPELTAEKFIADPFATSAGEPGMLYRTGDLARYLPDGNLECLGRMDFQVKIRGYRIELGEIEAVLGQHPAVKEAAAWVWEDASARRLAAYIVPEAGQPLRKAELRAFLAERLPEYMLPAVFVFLDALPLTSNGKVDHKGLPRPELERDSVEGVFIAPRNALETTLATVWSSVLGIEQVGIEDNFFELGGDSILSLQVISRARQAGIALTPRLLFEHATIEQLAQALESGQAPQAVTAEQGLLSGPSGLLPIQYYFFDNYAATLNQFNTSMLLSVGPQLEPPLLERALRKILAHHDALRLELELTPGPVRARYAQMPERLPFWYTDLSGLPSEVQRARIEQQAGELQQSFDICRAPLIRMVYFNLGAGSPGRLLIILHHLVSDGVSWRILVPDLARAYAQLSQGQVVQLPAKTSSFRAWAEGLAALAQAPEVLGELEHWRRLAAAGPMHLPADFPGGENLFGVTAELTVSLSPADSQTLLRQAASSLGGQINAILLAGLARALAKATGRQSGRHNLLVEMEGHGREDVLPGLDLSRTVGWFTSIFPQLVQIDLDMDSAHQVQAIQNQLDSTPRSGLGFGLLRYLNPDGQVRRLMETIPQPQINFNYLGQFGQDGVAEAGIFQMADESVGNEQNPQARRSADLYLVAIVNGGQLHTRWLYSQKLHRVQTIEKIANLYLDELHKMINLIVK